MSKEDKIAVLIPVYNAGALLAQSIASIADSGLLRGSYEIIITDNASSDGSIEQLPSQDAQGAPIHLKRNGANLGRVQNWNCALAAAEEQGFGHAIFLMAGDLLHGGNVMALRRLMLDTGAVLGLASYEIVDETLHRLRDGRRIIWRAKGSLSAQRFLVQSFAIGGMLLAPLGANLYDLSGPALRFDPDDPTHTDQRATADFLLTSGRPLIYLDRPAMRWRRRTGRFHSGMDLMQRLARDRALSLQVCREAGISAGLSEIRCTSILRIIFHAGGNILSVWTNLHDFVRDDAPIRWPFLFAMLLRQLIYRTPWRISD